VRNPIARESRSASSRRSSSRAAAELICTPRSSLCGARDQRVLAKYPMRARSRAMTDRFLSFTRAAGGRCGRADPRSRQAFRSPLDQLALAGLGSEPSGALRDILQALPWSSAPATCATNPKVALQVGRSSERFPAAENRLVLRALSSCPRQSSCGAALRLASSSRSAKGSDRRRQARCTGRHPNVSPDGTFIACPRCRQKPTLKRTRAVRRVLRADGSNRGC